MVQLSQPYKTTGEIVWYSCLFKNFPQFFVIHTIKLFNIVNEAEIDAFFVIPLFPLWSNSAGNLIWFSLPFLNLSCISVSSQFMYCWNLAWRILNITLLACELSATVWQFENSLALPLFRIGMKTDVFQSCGHCWVFQICWHIECSTLTALYFKTLNSSAGTPSPPLKVKVKSLSPVWLLWPNGLYPTRLLCPWDFLGKNTGVGCHFLLQEIFPTQGSNLGLPHCR